MTLDGKEATNIVIINAGTNYNVTVTASDTNGDTLAYTWEILVEPPQSNLGSGGSYEPRPARYGSVFNTDTNAIEICLTNTGQFRVFVYVKDGMGHVGTANIPFKVQ
jgi:hypothetical protein